MQFAAKISELPDWGKKVVQVAGQEILLVKTKGSVFACETECPHQFAPLQGAVLKEIGRLSCPRHGYRFDLVTGECEGHPEFRLKVYAIEIRGEEIFVELG